MWLPKSVITGQTQSLAKVSPLYGAGGNHIIMSTTAGLIFISTYISLASALSTNLLEKSMTLMSSECFVGNHSLETFTTSSLFSCVLKCSGHSQCRGVGVQDSHNAVTCSLLHTCPKTCSAEADQARWKLYCYDRMYNFVIMFYLFNILRNNKALSMNRV